ncbi:MAG TPA: M20/M25/M40 family metallo-hydrolase [Holophagaceae bacterium]|jgi:carboxypeptidase Q|nr:M20/M25/M40 family metallo-hydrolase [Holophagaceae bacterium]
MKRLLLLTALPLLAQAPPQADLARLRAVCAAPSPELTRLRLLCDGIGGRVTGSPAFQRALQWGLDGFKAAGVAARVEPFTLKNGWEAGPVEIQIAGPLGFTPKATSWGWSAPCDGSFTIVDGGDGSDAALQRLGAKAKGAFVYLPSEPMTTPEALFGEYFTTSRQTARLRALGAAGLLAQSTRPKKLLYRHVDPLLGDGAVSDIVELQIAREDGARLARLLKDGPAQARIRAANRVTGPTAAGNVIAEIPGTDLKDEVVLIGAHLDSWELGTGAQDNGCNAAMVVELARLFRAADLHPRRTVRFALFGGEEQGMLGSKAYAAAHRGEMDRIRAVLIYDEGLGQVSGFSLGGRPEWRPILDDALAPLGEAAPRGHTEDAFVGTDNYDFMAQGVPTLIANQDWTDYLPNYHAESDTFDKVDPKALHDQTAQAAVLMWGLANAAQLPKRQSRDEIGAMFKATGMEPQLRAFGMWDGWMDGSRGRK